MLQRGKQLIEAANQVGATGFTVSLGRGMLAIAGGLLLGTLLVTNLAQSQQLFENITLEPNFSPDPKTMLGISGGSVTADSVAGRSETQTGPCAGFVDEQPDHQIVLREAFEYLSLQVESPEDTTLVIKGPGGSWCNDDAVGKNPGIAGEWMEGTYEVWVGSYEKDDYHPYVIRVSKLEP